MIHVTGIGLPISKSDENSNSKLILTINDRYKVFLTGYLMNDFKNQFYKKGHVKFQYFGYTLSPDGEECYNILFDL